MIFLFIIIIVILLLSIYWEFKDNDRINKRKKISDIKDDEERRKEYEFYGTFNYENNVQWRTIFIGAFISTIILYFLLVKNKSINKVYYIYIFLIIFITYYTICQFRTFHLYRIMANKIRQNDLIIL